MIKVVMGDNFNSDVRVSLHKNDFTFSISSRVDSQFTVTTCITGVSSRELQQLALAIQQLAFDLEKTEKVEAEEWVEKEQKS